jgi:outer membrane lipoprotein SlyB
MARGAYLAPAQEAGRTKVVRNVTGGIAAAMLGVLSGCGPSYSPNTYAAAAVQQANKVEQGEVVGVRQVGVSADAALGTVVGAAAGGIAGSQVEAGGPVTALSALGGSVLGGVVGSGVEHAEGDTKAFEYIVQQTNGDLVSVTQKDTVPLAIGEKVLVITGKQARVVADYTVPVPGWPPPPKAKVAEKAKPAGSPASVAAGPPAAGSAGAAAAGSAAAAAAGSAAAAAAGSAAAGSAVPPAAAAAVPPVSAPVAAALDGSHGARGASPTAASSPPTAASAPSTGSPPAGSSPATADPGAPVSLAVPAAPASPTPATVPPGATPPAGSAQR